MGMFIYNADGVRELGNMVGKLYNSNPVLIAQDQVIGYWFDNWMHFVVKCYYWPMFMVSASDNIQGLFDPKTYSICKL